MPRAVAFALANAVIIAIYTVVDGQGVRVAGVTLQSTLQYVAAIFVLDGWPFALLILALRGKAFSRYALKRWPLAGGGALAALGSYDIALWAMTQEPVATVAALRETSVMFATLIGSVFLHEVVIAKYAMGVVIIFGGILSLRQAP